MSATHPFWRPALAGGLAFGLAFLGHALVAAGLGWGLRQAGPGSLAWLVLVPPVLAELGKLLMLRTRRRRPGLAPAGDGLRPVRRGAASVAAGARAGDGGRDDPAAWRPGRAGRGRRAAAGPSPPAPCWRCWPMSWPASPSSWPRWPWPAIRVSRRPPPPAWPGWSSPCCWPWPPGAIRPPAAREADSPNTSASSG